MTTPSEIPANGAPRVYVCLPPMEADALQTTLATLATAFPDGNAIASTPDAVPAGGTPPGVSVLTTTSSTPSQASLVPAAADYVNAWTSVRDQISVANQPAAAIVVLGPEASSVSAGTLQRLTRSVLNGQDLVVPRYPMAAAHGLINGGILYPMTRALFSNPLRYPLPIDVALSPRMAERLATAGQHLTASNKSAAFIWPVAEAVFARMSTCDVAGDPRTLPQPDAAGNPAIFEQFVSSLFADAEAKAAFWQRAQLTGRSHPRNLAAVTETTPRSDTSNQPGELIEAFRAAQSQFSGLWSLVLPPNSLLAFKKLSHAPASEFYMPETLWARTVFDFFLGCRLRFSDHSTLFSAFLPLYRGWVASHLVRSQGESARSEEHIEHVARAFETEKPYLIARWRWPDRFNP